MPAIAAAEAFASAAEIGMWFVGAWIGVEVLRLVFSGFGAGANAGGFLGGLNRLFTNMPGGGGGGGGGGNSRDLRRLEQAIQQGFANMGTQFNTLGQNVGQVRQLTTETRDLTILIHRNTQEIINRFTRWQAVFDEIRNWTADILRELQAQGRTLADHTRILADNTRILTDIQTRATQFQTFLEVVRNQIITQIDALDQRLNTIMQDVARIVTGISGVGTNVGALNQKLDGIRAAMLRLPEQVRVQLIPELSEILDAIQKIPGGNIDAIKVLVEESQKKIAEAITEAKKEIIDNARVKIYGDNKSSMFTKLKEILEQMKKDIEDTVSGGKSGNEAIQQISKINGDGNQVNQTLVLLTDELTKALHDLPELVENLKNVENVVGSAAQIMNSRVTLEKAAAATSDLTSKVSDEATRRQGALKKVTEAKEKLNLSREYNLAEAKKLTELHKEVSREFGKGQNIKKVRSILRSLQRLERRENYRVNMNELIAALKELGNLIDQNFLSKEEQKWRSYENDQIRGLPLIKKYLNDASGETKLAKMGWDKLPGEANKLIEGMKGLIIIENSLLKMIERAEEAVKSK